MMKLIKILSGRKTIFLIALVYTITITVAFLYPGVSAPVSTKLPLDKVVHIILHTVLIYSWLHYYFAGSDANDAIIVIGLLFICCLTYGIVVEILQGILTSDRQTDLFDIFANCAGSILGIIAFVKTKENK